MSLVNVLKTKAKPKFVYLIPTYKQCLFYEGISVLTRFQLRKTALSLPEIDRFVECGTSDLRHSSTPLRRTDETIKIKVIRIPPTQKCLNRFINKYFFKIVLFL